MPWQESQFAPSAECGSHVRGIHNSTVQTARLRNKALMELKILKVVYPDSGVIVNSTSVQLLCLSGSAVT